MKTRTKAVGEEQGKDQSEHPGPVGPNGVKGSPVMGEAAHLGLGGRGVGAPGLEKRGKGVLRDAAHWAAEAAAVDAKGNSALMVAARQGKGARVARLLPWSDPDAINRDGQTALMLAAKNARADCVALLLGSSNPNRLDVLGDTALILALRSNSGECARALLDDPRTDANLQGTHRHSPLIAAIIQAGKDGDLAWVRELMDRSDESALTAKGSKTTALMFAAREGNLECVKLLASACDAKARDLGGATAIDLAVRCGHWECVNFLALLSEPERAERYFKQGGEAKMPLWASRCAREEARQIWTELDDVGREGGSQSEATSGSSSDSREPRDGARRL